MSMFSHFVRISVINYCRINCFTFSSLFMIHKVTTVKLNRIKFSLEQLHNCSQCSGKTHATTRLVVFQVHLKLNKICAMFFSCMIEGKSHFPSNLIK